MPPNTSRDCSKVMTRAIDMLVRQTLHQLPQDLRISAYKKSVVLVGLCGEAASSPRRCDFRVGRCPAVERHHVRSLPVSTERLCLRLTKRVLRSENAKFEKDGFLIVFGEDPFLMVFPPWTTRWTPPLPPKKMFMTKCVFSFLGRAIFC